MSLKFKFSTEQNSSWKKFVRPIPNFMPLVEDGLLGMRWLRNKSTVVLLDPKSFMTL